MASEFWSLTLDEREEAVAFVSALRQNFSPRDLEVILRAVDIALRTSDGFDDRRAARKKQSAHKSARRKFTPTPVDDSSDPKKDE